MSDDRLEQAYPAEPPPAAAASTGPALSIAAVERDTRISKDTLRIWEKRYGFPTPERDTHGERLYPPDQVERLRHIRRLIDSGHRPGRIVSLTLDELKQVDLARQSSEEAGSAAGLSMTKRRGHPAGQPEETAAALLDILRSHQPRALRRALGQQLLTRGLAPFITEVATPLLTALGEAWSLGQIQVFEEHLCSETLEAVLRHALAGLPDPETEARPRVLLTTLPLEAHGLGLLMAEALFAAQGCDCMNLGRQTPVGDLLAACRAHQADVVALSFSSAAQPYQAVDAITQLRASLPADTAVWVGCTLTAVQRRAPDGVRIFTALEELGPAVMAWRDNAGRVPAP